MPNAQLVGVVAGTIRIRPATGTARAGAEGGIARAVGTLATGRRIGVKVDSATKGTLVAQGLFGRTVVMGSFRGVRLSRGRPGDLRVTRVGATPVILLHQGGRDITPDREVLRNLAWIRPHVDALAHPGPVDPLRRRAGGARATRRRGRRQQHEQADRESSGRAHSSHL
jgi:hypothetical protein